MWKDKINMNNWETKIVVLSLVFAILTICYARTYRRYVALAAQKIPAEFFVNDVQENYGCISLKRGKVSQTVQIDYNGLSAVGIKFEKPEDSKKGGESARILVQIFDTEDQKMVQSRWIPIQQIENRRFEKILLEKELVGNVGSLYRIEISLEGEAEIYLHISKKDSYAEGQCRQSGKRLEGDISFSLFGGSYQFIKGGYFLVGFFLLFCIMVDLAYIAFWKKIKLENVFLFGTLLFGMMYSIVLPPFSAPDENAHFVMAYRMSDDILGKGQIPEEDRVQENPYHDEWFGLLPNLDTYRRVYHGMASSEQDFISVYDRYQEYLQDNSIVGGHFIQAVAIVVGKLLHFSFLPLVYFVRMINLLFYCAVTYLAIRIMPVGKFFMFGITFLPMVFEQAASVSYDGWIISFAFLYIAYCMHCIYEKDKVTVRDTLLLLLLLFLCSNFKYIYYLMGGLMLLIPREKLEKKKQQYIILGVLLLFFVGMTGKTVIENYSRPISAEQLERFDRGQTYRIPDLLCHPDTLFRIYINTVRDSAGVYLEQMIGQLLGSLNIQVNRIYIYMLFLLLFLVALSQKGKKKMVSRKQCIVFVSVFFGVVLSSMLAMLTAWTNVSSDMVEGVQGRYFLPVLPLLGLLVFKLPIRWEKDISRKIITVFFVINYCVILDVFEHCLQLG